VAAESPAKPRVALAFFPGLERLLLAEPERRALAESAELLEERPLSALGEERAASLLAESEVLLSGWGCPPIDSVLLDRAPRLRLVAHAAGTVKGLVTPELFERGVRVSSAAAANALPVAEYTLAAILLANKGAFWSDHAYHRAGAAAAGVAPEVGNRGKCVGIVGASRVGRLVIERLRPFELSVLLYDPFVDEAAARTLGVASVELGELLRRSDVVSLHAPLLRGKVVDAAALEAELVSGRLRAVIDTSDPEPLPDDSPLRGLDNVFLTPHIAGSLGSEIGRMAELAIAEIARFARGEPLEHEVLVSDLERIA
jgi:phosphoglycerate dehydrogenase-like enzyme